jgi:hypothetical protein
MVEVPSYSPRMWSPKGAFIALPENAERALEAADPEKHSRYVGLRDAAVACEAAERTLKGLGRQIENKRIELRDAIKARDTAHAPRTFHQEWAALKRCRR